MINTERQFFTTEELMSLKSGIMLFDVEIFRNYFLVAFKCFHTGKYGYFEAMFEEQIPADWLYWFLSTFCLVGFNSKKYDLVMCSLAVTGNASIATLKDASDDLIVRNENISTIQRGYNFEYVHTNNVDLIEVAPLKGSLKLYGARLHCKHLQDLPYSPDTVLTREEIANVRTYCFNDLDNTELLLKELSPHLELRANLSEQFNKDLRSLSDAQLAQEIINGEIARIVGKYPKRPGFEQLVGTSFKYVPPAYVKFQSPELNAILAEICDAEIVIGTSGHVVCPKSIDGRKIVIGGKSYTIGMGGLHSNEQRQALNSYILGNAVRILDRDVTGYYPNLILKNGFAPAHLGAAFLEALQAIVDKRYRAKKAYELLKQLVDKIEADSLKIASNGTFGKTSDPYSTIYSPPMMVQTTLTGQLSLVMVIERLVLAGFVVISANTDGIVTLVPDWKYEEFCAIFKQWEIDTKLETEETEYKALYSRDVNNYIAVKMDGKHKAKGAYSEFGSALNSSLSKNPTFFVVVDAVVGKLTKETPVETTIRQCQNITRFVTVRNVTGGAQKDGRYLGKVVRWYLSTNVVGTINKCLNGHKVDLSEGGKPCMVLPDVLPTDIDYERYITMANEILEDIGYQRRKNEQLSLMDG